MPRRLLVFAAHADDEVLGCGGTMADLAVRGWRVDVCVITDSTSAQYPDDAAMQRRRKQQCLAACKRLGVKEATFLDYPDMHLDGVPHATLNDSLAEQIRERRPGVVFTHWSEDLNRDHRIVSDATAVATRPGLPFLQKVFEYETLSSSEWQPRASFLPTTFYPIAGSLDRKLKAFRQYKDEIRSFPHPRSTKGIKALAAYRGSQSGTDAAEAFRLVRSYGGL